MPRDLRRRYLNAHPSAEAFVDFKDFSFFRIAPVGNPSGRRLWPDHRPQAGAIPDRYLAMPTDLLEAEQGAVEHMNDDHREAMNLYATKLLGAEAADWRCTGCDPDGMDMQAGRPTLRLDFPERVTERHGAAQDAGSAGRRSAGQGRTRAQRHLNAAAHRRDPSRDRRPQGGSKSRHAESRNRLMLVAGLALPRAPASLSRRIGAERSIRRAERAGSTHSDRAGKYSEATAAGAEACSRAWRRRTAPRIATSRAALNNLGQVYGSQGHDDRGRAALQARDRDLGEGRLGLDSADDRRRAEQSRRAVPAAGAAMPRPSRCSSARWPSARRRCRASIPMSASRSTIWRRSMRSSSRHGDSEPLFKRALAIYEKAGGPEHPAVATLLNNLGQVDKVSGRYAEAEPLIKRSLAIREKVLGPRSSRRRALAEQSRRPLRAARALCRCRAALSRARWRSANARVGPDHPDTATSTNNLAYFLSVPGRTARRVAAACNG